MAKKSPKEIAAEVFEKNPKATKVFVCGGYGFLSENAANLHANTSKSKKKLEVVTVLNQNNTVTKDTSEDQKEEKSIGQMNKVELQEKVTELGIEFVEEDTKAVLKDKINKVLNAKVSE